MKHLLYVFALLLAGCDLFRDEEPKPRILPEISFPVQVEYRISGSEEFAGLEMINETGERASKNVTLPWSLVFDADSLRPLYVRIQSQKPATVRLVVNGLVIDSSRTEEPGDVAGILDWSFDTNPAIVYTFTAQDASDAEIWYNTPKGEKNVRADEMRSSAANIFLSEKVHVSPGFRPHIRGGFQLTNIQCPQSSIGYVSDDNLYYLLAARQSCEPGFRLEARTPNW